MLVAVQHQGRPIVLESNCPAASPGARGRSPSTAAVITALHERKNFEKSGKQKV